MIYLNSKANAIALSNLEEINDDPVKIDDVNNPVQEGPNKVEQFTKDNNMKINKSKSKTRTRSKHNVEFI